MEVCGLIWAQLLFTHIVVQISTGTVSLHVFGALAIDGSIVWCCGVVGLSGRNKV